MSARRPLSVPRRRGRTAALVALLVAAPLSPLVQPASAAPDAAATATIATARQAAPESAGVASAFAFNVLAAQQPAPCVGAQMAFTTDPFISRKSCANTRFAVTGATGALTAELRGPGSDTPFATPTVNAPSGTATTYSVSLVPTDAWPAGKISLRIKDTTGTIGESSFFYNSLVATVVGGPPTKAGDPFTVIGTIVEHSVGATASDKAVPAAFTLRTTRADGTVVDTRPVTAATNGTFTATIPGTATAGLTDSSGKASTALAVSVVDASYTDTAAVPPPATGKWASALAGTGSHQVAIPATNLTITNSFVSSVGWVKPGEVYPSSIKVRNDTTTASTPTIALTAPTGTAFTSASGPGSHVVAPVGFTWSPGEIAPGASSTLVLTSTASRLSQLPTVVWRDLSSVATLKVDGRPDAVATSHGPKVIPQSDIYNTARYGDRPFPIVPVQYNDRDFQTNHTGELLAEKINSPDVEGSTYNLYQEMSIKQLFPNGTVPSSDIATADFKYTPGFEFQKTVPGGTCTGTTNADLPIATNGTELYPTRITNGIYNLPGQTQFYGADANGSAVVGSASGVGALQNIDAGCGPTGKLVHDAAALADPELDYSDFDTDKDGVVDFFMVVFAGCGGNGGSQLGAAACPYPSDATPYDNIWPHSSTLEGAYTDPVTGLPGFVTDDQLKDLEGRPLWYTDKSYSEKTTMDMGNDLKVFVRVGPYNVNPETAIDNASVISHEYGHSLGLPDFYSTGSRETYGDWNLMATDKSQNMDAYSRQELGWVVPKVLEADKTTKVTNFKNSKEDIGSITWRKPDGTPYTLANGTDGTVHNSEMYVAKLPGRQLLDPAAFTSGEGSTPKHLWWSGSGNDFGCPPTGGRNLDLSIPALRNLPAGTPVELQFKSRWDIEWDFDYAFVLTTKDGGSTYTSHTSKKSYTTSKSVNPNQNGCLDTYDNGLTGTSGSYQAGTQDVDRRLGNTPAPVFLSDAYDISDLAGQKDGALRFSYSTDPGLARPGWFIDDVKVVATINGAPQTIYTTDFETSGDPADDTVFNGGCNEDLTVASRCTKGWKYLAAGAASIQDHAYYLEMRDRSSFDFEGRGENDRDAIGFEAGLYLSYTDEAHGYGNVGTDDPPAQSPIDSVPTVGSATPTLNDASFNSATGARSTYTDAAATPHVDNYTDPSSKSGNWEFGYDCLGFQIDRIEGTDAALASNLTGDVTFTMGKGCGEFDYGIEPETTPPTPTNTAPVAAIAGPATATTGQLVQFSGAGSTDAETPGNLDYSWDFGDGGTTKDATGPTPSVAYSAPGTYTVTLTVLDPGGLSNKVTKTITVTGTPVANTAPVADAAANPTMVAIGQTVALSGQGSTDAQTPDGLTYSWDFDNGAPTADATTRDTMVSYTAAGTYDVTLTVTDPEGLSSTDTVTITVTTLPQPNTAPTARATATPTTAAAGAPVALDARGSTDNETPSAQLTYSWDFGDGGTMRDATGSQATATYAAPGSYVVTVTVTDPQGASSTDSLTVTVTGSGTPSTDTTKPIVRLRVVPAPVFVNRRSFLSAATSTDDVTPSAQLKYSWNRLNGGTTVDATGPNLPLFYRNPGVRSFVLTVTDAAGNSTVKTMKIRVYRYVGCGTRSARKTDDFKVRKSSRALGGSYCAALRSTPGRDSVTVFFRGSRLDLYRGLAPKGGTAAIFVDGKRKGSISFKGGRALTLGHRRTLTGFGPGKHRLEIRRVKGQAFIEGFLFQ